MGGGVPAFAPCHGTTDDEEKGQELRSSTEESNSSLPAVAAPLQWNRGGWGSLWKLPREDTPLGCSALQTEGPRPVASSICGISGLTPEDLVPRPGRAQDGEHPRMEPSTHGVTATHWGRTGGGDTLSPQRRRRLHMRDPGGQRVPRLQLTSGTGRMRELALDGWA